MKMQLNNLATYLSVAGLFDIGFAVPLGNNDISTRDNALALAKPVNARMEEEYSGSGPGGPSDGQYRHDNVGHRPWAVKARMEEDYSGSGPGTQDGGYGYDNAGLRQSDYSTTTTEA